MNYGSIADKRDFDADDVVEEKQSSYWKRYCAVILLLTAILSVPLFVYTGPISNAATFGESLYQTIPTFPPSPYGSAPPMVVPEINTAVKPTVKPSTKPTVKPSTKPTVKPSTKPNAVTSDISFTTKRNGYDVLSYFYTQPSEIYKYSILESYAGVIEPHATMWLSTFDEAESMYHQFTIYNNDDTRISATGFDKNTTFSFGCTALTDTYTVYITQYSEKTHKATGKTGYGELLCMYVRREFSSLSAEDLAKTMDAMWKMWELDEDSGQALYGDSFHNYAYLLEFHYFNAAWIHSDHIHEGNGFLAQHIKISNIFEVSMQAIDPSVTLPYWDFTKESAQNISIWDSFLFTEKTFGTLTLPNDLTNGWLFTSNSVDDGKIVDGRWANLKADKNTKYTELDYAYGYMRAPWNMNPSKYITRYTSIDKTLPTCESHYTLLEYSEIVDFLHQVPYAAHASSHGVIGGVFGCDAMDDLREAGYINGIDGQLNLCKNWIFYLKEFYRSAVLVPSSGCSASDSQGDYSTDFDDLDCYYICDNSRMNILFLMLQHSVLNSDYDCIPEYGVMPDEGWKAWKEFICGGDGSKVFGGDHLESASPADPSFWPIHPSLERLLQVKYMAGGFTSNDWPSDASSEYVCNKATCYEEDEGDFGTWSSCCYGHYQDDQMLDAPNNDRYSYVGPTNREIHDGTDPTSSEYSMTYIYDNFNWTHCIQGGYDFNTLITELYDDAYFNVSSSDSEKGW